MNAGRRLALGGLALGTAALSGCGSFVDDLDLDTFTQAPAVESFDLSRLKPAESVTYIELRTGYGVPGEDHVVASDGTKCAEATDEAACVAAFDALGSQVGFGGCADCGDHYYYAVNRGDQSWTAGSLSELLTLFGTIDAAEEALSIASSQGYYWSSTSKEEGAYRQAESGYELIVKKLVSGCMPVESDLYLLWVHAEGAVEILEQEVLDKEQGACI